MIVHVKMNDNAHLAMLDESIGERLGRVQGEDECHGRFAEDMPPTLKSHGERT